MSSPTKAPVARRHREMAALTLSTGHKLEEHVSRWVAGEETAHRVFGDVAQSLADIEAATEARVRTEERAAVDTLLASLQDDTFLSLSCERDQAKPISLAVIDGSACGEGSTLAEAARNLCEELGLTPSTSLPEKP